ncbi:Crp/Fnr family transcriptional regulator [Xanthovirga aplysinae]|uniref:Crp/Fnr family transcriptional regulator n=1 Tax=Xanthovirga aplysinae TaxID=2529853 RepID=UPI0012BC80F4|nr:Crp/Fnr family transcriptional regulator [Xanthovirga aplysinae]MTI30032.1 Crp/Fnr family transcriptional regulator [Xanthovirga aplysinae]
MENLFEYFDKIHSIGKEAKSALSSLVRVKNFDKNEIIQKPYSICSNIYIVKDGIARIFYYKDGNDITEHFAFPKDVIVRAESLFNQSSTPKGIQAIENTEVFAINSIKLFQMYNDFHDIERLFRLIFEKEYVNTVKRMESLQIKSATERYIELSTETDFLKHIPLKYIASYLGITQVSLSRIRANLK